MGYSILSDLHELFPVRPIVLVFFAFLWNRFLRRMYFFIFVVITSSCESNYHTVTTTTVPGYEWNRTNSLMFLITTVLCSYIKQPSNDVNVFSSNTHVRSKVCQELYHYVVYIANARRNIIIINKFERTGDNSCKSDRIE